LQAVPDLADAGKTDGKAEGEESKKEESKKPKIAKMKTREGDTTKL
jgi:hypothetical protein